MATELRRFKDNPILLPTKNSWENKAVFNCGVTEFGEKILLLYRAQGDDMISRFGVAFSEDGYHISERLDKPIFEPDPDSEYEAMGVEDPRISKINDTYYILYTAASLYPDLFRTGVEHRATGEVPWRVRLSIAHTRDFKTFYRHGVIVSHIDSKDGALFPELINGEMLLLHRIIPDIRMAVAEDVKHFQERGPVFGPRGAGWDSRRVGSGAPPIKTPYGWVLIYHGVDQNSRYSLGLALLDLYDPIKVLARSTEPILTPEKKYEEVGQVGNVVFTCGAIRKGEELLVYYGGADSTIEVASVSFHEVLEWAKAHHEAAHRVHPA